MAGLGEKLKGLNWKAVLIDHCEKIVLGGVGLFVLIAMGGTQWSTYKTEPGTFAEKTKKGENTFKSARWPQERKTEFEARDLGDVVDRVTDGIPASQGDIYSWTAKWSPGVYKEKELVDEPKYERLIDPIANAGRVLIALLPEANAATTTPGVIDGSVPGKPSTGLPADDEFAPRPGTVAAPVGAAPGAGSVAPAAGAHAAGAAPAPPRPARGGGGAAAGGAHSAGPAPDMAMMMEGGMSSGGGALGPKVNAEGKRVVAVRAVFPMKTQLELMRKAMKLENANQAFEHVRFWDFKIQRQTAVAGANPWPAAWEELKIDSAVDILSRAEFDVDVVDDKYREATFTMPLPLRVYGIWGAMASHPQIKKLLTDEEATQQEAKNQAAIEAAKNLKNPKAVGGRGFRGVQHDTKGMMRQIQGDTQAMNTFNQSYGESMGMDSGMGARGMPGAPGGGMGPQGMMGAAMGGGMGSGMGQGPLVAMPDLLLFRYLDFDVVPGNAYRYRVQLEFRNPNFQRDATDLKDPSSANGETRLSAWSEATNPTVIEDELRIFVTKVEKNTTANLESFQYQTDSGTYVKAPLEKLGRGEPIAKFTRTDPKTKEKIEGVLVEVARPAQQTFMNERIDFETPNVLVDLGASTILNPDEHPDLELGSKKILARREEAIMVNRFGELVEIDSVTQKAAQDKVQGTMESQSKAFSGFKQNVAAAGMTGGAGGLEGYLTGGGADAAAPAAGAAGGGPAKRKKSALKMQPGMGSGMGMGMGMEGGMPGMPAAGAGGPRRGGSAK